MKLDFQKNMALLYDKINGIDQIEINFWNKICEKYSGDILELGCGTGRILLNILQKGFQISGLDDSKEMVKVLKRKIKTMKGVYPKIYIRTMLNIKIKKKYDLVILGDGGLSLFTEKNDIMQLFQEVYNVLKPNGVFVFDAMLVSLRDKKCSDNPYQWHGAFHHMANGDIVAQRKLHLPGPNEHCWEGVSIYEIYKKGKLKNTEFNIRSGRDFFADEILNYLSESKFMKYSSYSWLTEDIIKPEDTMGTFICFK